MIILLTAESYPTCLRSFGSGFATGVGKTASLLGPIIAGVVLVLTGNINLVFIYSALFMTAAGLSAFGLKETRGVVILD